MSIHATATHFISQRPDFFWVENIEIERLGRETASARTKTKNEQKGLCSGPGRQTNLEAHGQQTRFSLRDGTLEMQGPCIALNVGSDWQA